VAPFQWFVAALCGWIHREQDDVIAFLREENQMLRAQLRGRRVRLRDDEQRRLALLGHQLGRATLAKVATIVTAEDPEGTRRPSKPATPDGLANVRAGALAGTTRQMSS
jgi:hypothetical protein